MYRCQLWGKQERAEALRGEENHGRESEERGDQRAGEQPAKCCHSESQRPGLARAVSGARQYEISSPILIRKGMTGTLEGGVDSP